ncbi:MAG: DUF2520 domain-containing protein [Bacteroidota bacterium]|nr:DUF2520 domain-containing protein [Bacteroidota bacterium]
MTKVVLIGAGHLAFYFYKQFLRCKEVNLTQWFNRSIEKIDFAKPKVAITNQLSQIKSADLYLICVSDDAIESISKKIKTKGLIAHCAGGVPLNRLRGSSRKAVFYPLQTFTKGREMSFEHLPFCIETTQSKDRILLNELTNNLGGVAHEFNSEKRALIHLIAVLINNFGNHLLHLGSELSKKHEIPFQIFHSLIEETYQKAFTQDPKDTQTGPALRRDQGTIDKHIDLLTDKDLKKLYLNLTTSIQKKHE